FRSRPGITRIRITTIATTRRMCKEDVHEPAHGGRRDQTQKPKDNQDDRNRLEHDASLPGSWRIAVVAQKGGFAFSNQESVALRSHSVSCLSASSLATP